MPRISSLCLHAWQRLKAFVFRAGYLIVPICILIGALNAINLDGTMNTGDADTRSLLSVVGQAVTPIFSPMELHADNWPATVGSVTGVLCERSSRWYIKHLVFTSRTFEPMLLMLILQL